MEKRKVRIFLTSILSVCFILTGCSLSVPTYGTGSAVSVQFLEDIANSSPLKSKNNNNPLVLKPHPQLVLPNVDSHTALPLPQ